MTPEQHSFWRPRPSIEFYDLDADPDQVVNLAGESSIAEVEGRLASALREHMLADRLDEKAPAITTVLATRLEIEDDATVKVALAEALSQVDPSDEIGIAALVRLAGPERPFGVRLEALNALGCLPPERLQGHLGWRLEGRDPNPFISQAIEYLELQVSGRYEPSAPIGPWVAIFEAEG